MQKGVVRFLTFSTMVSRMTLFHEMSRMQTVDAEVNGLHSRRHIVMGMGIES